MGKESQKHYQISLDLDCDKIWLWSLFKFTSKHFSKVCKAIELVDFCSIRDLYYSTTYHLNLKQCCSHLVWWALLPTKRKRRSESLQDCGTSLKPLSWWIKITMKIVPCHVSEVLYVYMFHICICLCRCIAGPNSPDTIFYPWETVLPIIWMHISRNASPSLST